MISSATKKAAGSVPSPEETIALFEGILQTSPDDRMALEALAAAYKQAGNELRTRTTLLRLARVVLDKNDASGATNVIEMLRPLAMADFDAMEALTNLEGLVESNPQAASASAHTHVVAAGGVKRLDVPPSGVALDKMILNREMQLAWELFEAKEINQDEYSLVVDDLTMQISSGITNRTFSFLHSLVDRSIPGFEHIVQYIQRHGKCPYISLAAFDPQKCDLHGVPREYMIRQGALPFDTIDGELLIGVLNPMDSVLQRDITKYIGCKCHFYFVIPEEFDMAWAKVSL